MASTSLDLWFAIIKNQPASFDLGNLDISTDWFLALFVRFRFTMIIPSPPSCKGVFSKTSFLSSTVTTVYLSSIMGTLSKAL